MATNYTTKTSSDTMFADLLGNPGYAYEVDRTWRLIKQLLQKSERKRQFSHVNLKKLTESQWQEIYESVTKDPRDRRLFNQIITSRARPAIDDPEMWLYGPISEDHRVQDVVSTYSGHAATVAKKEEHQSSENKQNYPVTGQAAPPTTPSTQTDAAQTKKPEAVFVDRAREQLIAAQHPTRPTHLLEETIQSKASQLEQHERTAQNMQAIQANASGTKTPGKPPLTDAMQAYRDKAESTLQTEYMTRYKSTEQQLVQEKRDKLISESGGTLHGPSSKASSMRRTLGGYEQGNHYTRGRFDPQGRKIRTQLDFDTDRRFQVETGKEFIPGYEYRKRTGPDSFEIVVVPDGIRGISQEEIFKKAQELRLQDDYVHRDNNPALAGNSNSRFSEFDKRAVAIQAASRGQPPSPNLGFKVFDVRARNIQRAIPPSLSQEEIGYDQGQPEQSPYFPPPSSYDDSTQDEEDPGMRRRRPPNPRRLSPRGLTQGVKGAAQGARGAAQAVRGIATALRAAPLLANPYVLAGVGITLLILLVVVLLNKSGGEGTVNIELKTAQTQVENASQDCQQDSQGCADQVDNGDTSNKAEINLESLYAYNGQSVLGTRDTPRVLAFTVPDYKKFLAEIAKSIITYNIIVSYDGLADDISVTYPIIPIEAAFISATGMCHLTKDGQDRVTKVEWSMKENLNVPQTTFTKCTLKTTPTPTPTPTPPERQGVQGVSTQKVNFTTYTQSPYSLPPPGTSDTQYSTSEINYLNDLGARVARHQTYLISKTRGVKYVDPFLSVIWTGAIEGIDDNPYFWNCQDRSHDINAGCPGGFYSGGWQVGYGMQVSQALNHLAEDFDEAFGAGSSNNPTKVQQVGQAVISGSNGRIHNPTSFPNKSIKQLTGEAAQGSTSSRQAIAVLLLDKELGAIVIAREVAGDIAAQDNWASTMRGWGSYYGDNMQNFSSRAKAIADRYTGSSSSDPNPPGTSTGKTSFSPITFQIKVLPIKKDEIFTSQPATADVIGGVGGTEQQNGSTTNSSSSGTLTNATSLDGMFDQASKASGIPAPFIKGVNMLESGVISTWTDEDVKKFSQTSWWVNASQADIQRGWAFNQCDTLSCFSGADVRGIMQFELQTWNGIKSSISKTVSGHDPDRRYPADSIVGAGIFIRDIASTYDRAFGTSPNATSWPEDKVRRVATAYCTGSIYGNPNDPACNNGGAPYDDIVWRYYKEFGGK